MTPQIYIVAQTHTQHQIYEFLDGWPAAQHQEPTT